MSANTTHSPPDVISILIRVLVVWLSALLFTSFRQEPSCSVHLKNRWWDPPRKAKKKLAIADFRLPWASAQASLREADMSGFYDTCACLFNSLFSFMTQLKILNSRNKTAAWLLLAARRRRVFSRIFFGVFKSRRRKTKIKLNSIVYEVLMSFRFQCLPFRLLLSFSPISHLRLKWL